MATELVLWEEAKAAVLRARDAGEALQIHDGAAAFRYNAKVAKDHSMVTWASEMQIRAARRCGGYLLEMKADRRLADGRKNLKRGKQSPGYVAPTPGILNLSDIGVDKEQSSHWQKLAQIPDDIFEKAIAIAKEASGGVTTAAMLRVARTNKATDAKEPTAVATIDGDTGVVEEEPILEIAGVLAPIVEDDRTVPLGQYEALREKFEDLSVEFDKLVQALADVETIASGNAAKEMTSMRFLMEQAQRACDDAMNRAAEMRKQVNFYLRELKRLDWKGPKK